MKVAISANGKDLDSMINPRFGRCPNFIIVDLEGNEIKKVDAVENPGGQMSRGAGISAAQKIGNLGVTKVITGNVGPNAFMTLNQLGIEIYQDPGTAKDAIQKLIEGKLKKIDSSFGGGFGRGTGMGLGRVGSMGRGGGRRWQQ